MKKKVQFNRKRVAGMMISWSVFAGLFYWICSQNDRVTGVGLVALFCAVTLLAIWLAWRPFKILSILLAAALAFSQFDVEAQQDGDTNNVTLIEGLGAAIFVGVCVVLVAGLWKIAKKIPKNPPADPDDPPCPTNCLPRTNTIPTNTPPAHKTITVNNPMLTDAAVTIWDCSSNTLANTDPQGHSYQRWAHSRLESSPDQTAWSTVCRMHEWCSDYNLCVVFYTPDRQPWSTNFFALPLSTNSIVMPWLVADPKAMYFRLRDDP